MTDARPIGVFDSGIGGLTVLRALRDRLPHEHFVYLGDTARVPYGTRGPDTIVRYAQNNTRTLHEQNALKALVVACNTASAVALPTLRGDFDFPVLGVIGPGAAAAAQASSGGGIHVLATRGTVLSQAYDRAIAALGYPGPVSATPAPLLVGLVEEGWTAGDIPRAVVDAYLRDMPAAADVVVLGCTHFPMLRDIIAAATPGRAVVDGGQATANTLYDLLAARDLLRDGGAGDLSVFVTDGADHTRAMAERFLGAPIEDARFALIDVKMS